LKYLQKIECFTHHGAGFAPFHLWGWQNTLNCKRDETNFCCINQIKSNLVRSKNVHVTLV
jgi:hypothetical protein